MIKVKGRFTWFQIFKYTIYGMLLVNVFLFLNKEVKSAAHRFSDGVAFSDLIDAYSSTIDTMAWVLLLFLFELETFILSEKQLEGNIKWVLRILRSCSYAVICFAFYGYCVKYGWVMDFSTLQNSNLCSFVGQSWMVEVDEFETITTANCNSLNTASELLKKSGENILTDLIQWTEAFRLVLVDIFNSGAWILVVLVLEVDIWLKLKDKLVGKVATVSKLIKVVLYTVLVVAAIYWGYAGSVLEFWDAFLWIVAFIFIESNLFAWQGETDVPTSIL